jgi:hypothetical protein
MYRFVRKLRGIPLARGASSPASISHIETTLKLNSGSWRYVDLIQYVTTLPRARAEIGALYNFAALQNTCRGEIIYRACVCCPFLHISHLRITKGISYFERWFKKLLCGIVTMNDHLDVSTAASLLTFGVENWRVKRTCTSMPVVRMIL